MATRKNTTVSEPLKRALTEKAEQLLQDKFRPGLLIQAEAAKKHGFNYTVEVYTTWRGKYFYFCAKYRNPRENATQEYFEVRTTRKDVPCIQEPKERFGARIAQYVDPDGLAISVSEERRGS